jgi:hypothetical protein
MLVAIYFIITYSLGFGFAHSKAKNEYGWNTQLLITVAVFPFAIPFVLMMEMHNYLNTKSTF